jgi:hypothetical protein
VTLTKRNFPEAYPDVKIVFYIEHVVSDVLYVTRSADFVNLKTAWHTITRRTVMEVFLPQYLTSDQAFS